MRYNEFTDGIGLNASSIKTRIETLVVYQAVSLSVCVLTPLPLKQGLKQVSYGIPENPIYQS